MAARFPFPSFPRGWYVVAFSHELAPGDVRTVHYFDRDIVLYRGESGAVAAVDKTCPHLGAHLGGGKVEGDCLRCPFHGWKFEASGTCVEVPYAPKIPPRARVSTWPVCEKNGAVFVYYDAQGEQPSWQPPTLEEEGWTANRTIRWELRSHPQEVAENTVDCAHLGPVHHVESTRVVSVEQNAERMRVVLELVASGYSIGMPDEVNDVELDVSLHGLGVIMSQTHVITAGLYTRQRIHPTPIDGDRIAIFALANTREMPDPGYTREIDDIFWDAFVHDFACDFPIWENKAYLERPLLAGGDGPIGAYRKWARQFYVQHAQPSAPAGAAVDVAFSPLQRVRRILADSRRVLLELRRSLAPTTKADDFDDLPQASGAAPRRAVAEQVRRFASVESYFDTLARRFDPAAAGEIDAVFQWRLSGDRPFDHWATVKRGHIETASGVHATPTVTIEMSSDDYLRMINGELSGPFAFSTGRGRLRGPVRLAMRMQQLFPLDRQV
ncbi:MAG TPA: Rieske 2Fe-2S domain-containing protein [Nannocystaceae bacterium]|nr:Rieske 2Fe-2S domain-containing protein [Nannocystaceae bacterium]